MDQAPAGALARPYRVQNDPNFQTYTTFEPPVAHPPTHKICVTPCAYTYNQLT